MPGPAKALAKVMGSVGMVQSSKHCHEGQLTAQGAFLQELLFYRDLLALVQSGVLSWMQPRGPGQTLLRIS